MMCDVFRKLRPFGRLSSYRYVGFGSIYFADFALFHRALGIQRMTSIEREMLTQDRYRWNRPFQSIDLAFGHSNDVLASSLDEHRTILWLDYESKLSQAHLTDIVTFLNTSPTGSFLSVTVNIGADKVTGGPDAPSRLDQLIRRLGGNDRVPEATTEESLSQDLATPTYSILDEFIKSTVERLNVLRKPRKAMRIEQIFHLQYDDSAKMATCGWVVFDQSTQDRFAACEFGDLDFYSPGRDPFEIRLPLLTFRELYALDQSLPGSDNQLRRVIPQSERAKYVKLYRYFPNYAEMSI